MHEVSFTAILPCHLNNAFTNNRSQTEMMIKSLSLVFMGFALGLHGADPPRRSPADDDRLFWGQFQNRHDYTYTRQGPPQDGLSLRCRAKRVGGGILVVVEATNGTTKAARVPQLYTSNVGLELRRAEWARGVEGGREVETVQSNAYPHLATLGDEDMLLLEPGDSISARIRLELKDKEEAGPLWIRPNLYHPAQKRDGTPYDYELEGPWSPVD